MNLNAHPKANHNQTKGEYQRLEASHNRFTMQLHGRSVMAMSGAKQHVRTRGAVLHLCPRLFRGGAATDDHNEDERKKDKPNSAKASSQKSSAAAAPF